jgi:putative ABC transport system permease protein
MWRNYLKITFRSLLRYRGYAVINILGLAIGLACCTLIFLYTQDELSYDQFHQNLPQLYRANTVISLNNSGDLDILPNTPLPLGEAAKNEIPEIKAVVRFNEASQIIKIGEKTFSENVLRADANFFEVFSFPFLKGNPQQALQNPNSLVISQEIAQKYFGNLNPIGKTIALEIENRFEPFIITGLTETPPTNSSIKFGLVMPMKKLEQIIQYVPKEYWTTFYVNTFVWLKPQANPAQVEAKFPQLVAKHAQFAIEEAKKRFGLNGKMTFKLQKFTDIHLADLPTRNGLYDQSNPIYAYILSGIGVFILLIACINFTNLTIAQSFPRLKEIGIRKVAGATQWQLMGQFLGEAFLVCFLAFVGSLILAELSLPIFSELARKKLSLSYLSWQQFVGMSVGLLLITTFLAGFYPALVLARLQAIRTLKAKPKLGGKNWFTKSLVVFQFAIAVFLMICMLVMQAQLQFIQNQDLGYNYKNLVHFPTQFYGSERIAQLLKNELSAEKSILNISQGSDFRRVLANVNQKQITTHLIRTDYNALANLEIKLLQGRNFSPQFPSDTNRAVIVNEAFVKEAQLQQPINQGLSYVLNNNQVVKIIGVIKNFNFQSLRNEINPMMLTLNPEIPIQAIFMRLEPTNQAVTLNKIGQAWKKIAPNRPFEYAFQENRVINEAYKQDKYWQKIIMYASSFALLIACLGLFGLASLSITQRTKEIGICKVLGATQQSIIFLLTREFNRLIIIGIAISSPLAYWAIIFWLQNFAYRVNVNWWIFALAGGGTFLVAFLTIAYQSFKTAQSNPVEALRYE